MTATWATPEPAGGVKRHVRRGLWSILTALAVVGITGLVASDVAVSPDKDRLAGQVSTATTGARTRPPAAKPPPQKPPGKTDTTRKVAPVPPLASGIAGLVSPKSAAWLALGAVVVLLGLLARRRKYRRLALKLGLLALIAGYLLSGAPGMNLTIVGGAAGVFGCLSLMALLGAWEKNEPIVTFVKMYTAHKARRGLTIALFLAVAAVVCFRITVGTDAALDGLVREVRASLATLAELRSMLSGMSLLTLMNGGAAWSLISMFTSSVTYGLFFVAAMILALGWTLIWFTLGGSVVLAHRIILFRRQQRIAADVGSQQAYGSARIATPDDIARPRSDVIDVKPRRRFRK